MSWNLVLSLSPSPSKKNYNPFYFLYSATFFPYTVWYFFEGIPHYGTVFFYELRKVCQFSQPHTSSLSAVQIFDNLLIFTT